MNRDKLIDYISWGLLAVSLILLKGATFYLENIILGRKFIWNYFLLGLLIASVWMYLLYRWRKEYFKGGEKRASAILSQFFAIILLIIFGNAFYAFESGKSNRFQKSAIVTRKGHNLKSGKNYLHLNIDGRHERFNPRKAEFDKLAEGDTVILSVGKGANGYEVIYSFTKK